MCEKGEKCSCTECNCTENSEGEGVSIAEIFGVTPENEGELRERFNIFKQISAPICKAITQENEEEYTKKLYDAYEAAYDQFTQVEWGIFTAVRFAGSFRGSLIISLFDPIDVFMRIKTLNKEQMLKVFIYLENPLEV